MYPICLSSICPLPYPPPNFARKHVEIEYNAIICDQTEIASPLRSCQPSLRIPILSGKMGGGTGGKPPAPNFAGKHVEIEYNATICGHTEFASPLRSCQPFLRISILSGKIGGVLGGDAPATNDSNK